MRTKKPLTNKEAGPPEYKYLRRYSDEEIESLVKQEYIALAEIFGESVSKEAAQKRWKYLPKQQKALLNVIAVAVYRHVWYERGKGIEGSELKYPTQSHGSIPAFQSVEEERAFWDTHNMVDFQEDVQESQEAEAREATLEEAMEAYHRIEPQYSRTNKKLADM